MALANNIQMPVFNVNGSLNNNLLIIVKISIPMENPQNLEAQISPLYAATKCSTDLINTNEIGIAPANTIIGYF
jgi:hypothetical protein